MAETPKRNSSRRRGGTPIRQGTSTTPSEEYTGRVDHPVGKFEKWINQDETSASTVTITDNVTLETQYTVQVTDPGPNEEQVRTLMFGSDPRRQHSSFSASSRLLQTERDLSILVNQLTSAGAKFRIGKRFQVRSACPLKNGKIDDGSRDVYYAVEVTALGRFSSKVLDLLLGSDRNPNLEISLPFKLSYNESQRDEAFALVERLASLDAKVTITQSITVELPLD